MVPLYHDTQLKSIINFVVCSEICREDLTALGIGLYLQTYVE